MPPIAATMGRAAVMGSRRSPETISYLISSPTTKKKITIRASLTQCCRVSSRRKLPRSMAISVCQNESYDDAQGLLAQISAAVAASSRRMEPAASMRRNSRTGRATSRASGLLLAR
jgi:hypothetical protein